MKAPVVPCTRVFTGRFEPIRCRRNAVGFCELHGNICAIHSRYQPFGPRLCGECREPLGEVQPGVLGAEQQAALDAYRAARDAEAQKACAPLDDEVAS